MAKRFQFQSVRLKAHEWSIQGLAIAVSIPIGSIKSNPFSNGTLFDYLFQFQSVRLKVL